MKTGTMFRKLYSQFDEDERSHIFHTANRAGQILAACIIAEAVNNLAKAIKCQKLK